MLCPLDDSAGKNTDVSDQIRSIATETVHIGLSCQCAALPVIFFFLMFAALVDIDTFLSLAVLSPSFYKGVKGRVFPLGKDIFQFKNGLFIEKGRALM